MGRNGSLSLIRIVRPQGKGPFAGLPRVAQTCSGRFYGGNQRRALSSPISSLLSSRSYNHAGLSSSNVISSLFYSSSPPSPNKQQSTESPSSGSPSPDFSRLPGARQPRKPTPISRPLTITVEQAQSAFKHCVELVKKHDVDNYVAALLLPSDVRPHVFALLAFNVEISLIRDKVTADNKGTTGIYRLQFWKDTLRAIYGTENNPVPRQPVAVALCTFAPSAHLSLLESLVSARQETIGDRQFGSTKQIEVHSAATWGALLQLIARGLLGPDSLIQLQQNDVKMINHVAIAYGIANMIRSSLPLLSRGIILLPSDLFTLYSLSPDKVYNQKQKEEIKPLIRDLAKLSSTHLVAARSLKTQVAQECITAVRSAACSTDHILKVVSSVHYDMFNTKLQQKDPLHPARLLYRRVLGTF